MKKIKVIYFNWFYNLDGESSCCLRVGVKNNLYHAYGKVTEIEKFDLATFRVHFEFGNMIDIFNPNEVHYGSEK